LAINLDSDSTRAFLARRDDPCPHW